MAGRWAAGAVHLNFLPPADLWAEHAQPHLYLRPTVAPAREKLRLGALQVSAMVCPGGQMLSCSGSIRHAWHVCQPPLSALQPAASEEEHRPPYKQRMPGEATHSVKPASGNSSIASPYKQAMASAQL